MHSTGALGGDRELGQQKYGSTEEETTRLAEYSESSSGTTSDRLSVIIEFL